MDLFNILTYLNKLSLVAFFITAIVLIYQIIIMKRDSNKKNPTPVIPNFNENMAIPVKNYTSINEEKLIHKTQPMPKNIFFPIIGITIICLILVIYLINRQSKQVNIVNTNKIIPTLVVKRSILPTITKSSVLPTSTAIPTRIPAKTAPTLSLAPTSIAIPTRIPTTYDKETVIATYVTPSFTASPTKTKTKTLPSTGAIENSLIVTVISGFMIVLAFVF